MRPYGLQRNKTLWKLQSMLLQIRPPLHVAEQLRGRVELLGVPFILHFLNNEFDRQLPHHIRGSDLARRLRQINLRDPRGTSPLVLNNIRPHDNPECPAPVSTLIFLPQRHNHLHLHLI